MWGGGDDYILRSCSHPAGGDVTTSLVKVSWLHHQLPQAYKTSAFFFQVVFLLLLLSLTFVSFCFRVALIHVVKKKKKSAPLFPSEIRKFGREFTLLGDCLQLLLFSYFLYLSQPFFFFFVSYSNLLLSLPSATLLFSFPLLSSLSVVALRSDAKLKRWARADTTVATHHEKSSSRRCTHTHRTTTF